MPEQVPLSNTRASASRAASTFPFAEQPDAHIHQAASESVVCEYAMAEEPNTLPSQVDDNVSNVSPHVQIIDNRACDAPLPYEQAAGENRFPGLGQRTPSKSAMDQGDGDDTTPLG